MDACELLRHKARDKRDSIVRAANAEYRQTLRQIATLDVRLRDVGPKKSRVPVAEARTVTALIQEVIPKDRLFSFAECMELLHKADPKREFRMQSVRSLFQRLLSQGAIQRVCKSEGRGLLWGVAGLDVDAEPHAVTSLTDIAEQVLRDSGPLTFTQIVVEIQRRGCRPDAEPRTLIETLRRAFGYHRERFVQGKGGRWEAA